MDRTLEKTKAFPVARNQVRDLLTRSTAFRGLPEEKRRTLAHDMVKVVSFITGGETGDNLPAAATVQGGQTSNQPVAESLADNSTPVGKQEVAGAAFIGAAGKEGVQNLDAAIKSVDFPEFVSGLIDGVFTAIVDASIKQMEAYSELLGNAVKSIDQFMKDNISDNQARDYLAESYPDYISLDLSGQNPQARPADDFDEDSLPDFFADLGLAAPVDDLDEDIVEEVLVPAARRRMAMDRQQLLATMVLMGINRIVVTDGRIRASVIFKLDTTDMVARSFEQTAENSSGSYSSSYKRSGWFRPTSRRSSSWNRFKVTTTQEEDSEAQSKLKVNLKGDVDINFRSETFPLERMTDLLMVDQIQAKAPGFTGASAETEEETQTTA